MENLDAVSELTESSRVGDEAIAGIRERRAKITDYAVAASKQPLFGRVTECTVGNYPVFAAPDSPPVAYVADMEDAKFYAHAPTDIDTLLERLADNEQMLQRQIEAFNLEWAKRREVEQECERLRDQLATVGESYMLTGKELMGEQAESRSLREQLVEREARIVELERRLKIPFGKLQALRDGQPKARCAGCGKPCAEMTCSDKCADAVRELGER